MYGYTLRPHQYNDHPSIQTWEVIDGYDGGVPRCRECGEKTEVYSAGDDSTIVCTRCNVAAKVKTTNLNYGLAKAHRIVFPITSRRGW